MLTVVRGIAPRDETEALLAAQMAAIHNVVMTMARCFNRVTMIPQQHSASNTLNKLARTFTAQVEASKRYRSGGEQTVKVQHATVNDSEQGLTRTRTVAMAGGRTLLCRLTGQCWKL
jgi:hypothetical protein